MPYDITGRAITQEEIYRQEKWLAKRKRMRVVANIIAGTLAAIILIAGIVSIACGLLDMWSSGDAIQQILALICGFGLISAFVVSVFFARFEI